MNLKKSRGKVKILENLSTNYTYFSAVFADRLAIWHQKEPREMELDSKWRILSTKYYFIVHFLAFLPVFSIPLSINTISKHTIYTPAKPIASAMARETILAKGIDNL